MLIVLFAFLLIGCSKKADPGSLHMDQIFGTKIATSKGRAFADKGAARSCGEYRKKAVLETAEPNHDGSAIVYSYKCE